MRKILQHILIGFLTLELVRGRFSVDSAMAKTPKDKKRCSSSQGTPASTPDRSTAPLTVSPDRTAQTATPSAKNQKVTKATGKDMVEGMKFVIKYFPQLRHHWLKADELCHFVKEQYSPLKNKEVNSVNFTRAMNRGDGPFGGTETMVRYNDANLNSLINPEVHT